MIVVLVEIVVKVGDEEPFLALTRKKAAAANKLEEGVQFDVFRSVENSQSFTIVERYQDAAARKAHKSYPHYISWRDAVETMMAKERNHFVWEKD